MPARVRKLDSSRAARRTTARTGGAVLRKVAPVVSAPAPAAPPPPAASADGAGGSLFETFGKLSERLSPALVRSVEREVAERVRRIPSRLNSYGYDPWGMNIDVTRRAATVCALIYRYYFRVQTEGVRNVPAGRVLLISNHAGQVAFDGAMIGTAVLLEAEPPRIVRGMGEYWLPTIPFFNEVMVRTGSVVGTPKNCTDLLRNEEAVIAFPEGVRGMNKLFTQRYQLQRFGNGFMRLALSTATPIVPVAVVGSEEQAPGIANLTGLARLFGMPAFPITLTWPWLGPLGMLPLPVKYRIYFGEPMVFDGDADDEDAVIERKVQKVKDTIQSMLDRGVRERPGIFS